MVIPMDHVAIPVRDPEDAARFLGDVRGIEAVTDGPDDELRSLRLHGGAALLFARATAVACPHHVALRVGAGEVCAMALMNDRASGIA